MSKAPRSRSTHLTFVMLGLYMAIYFSCLFCFMLFLMWDLGICTQVYQCFMCWTTSSALRSDVWSQDKKGVSAPEEGERENPLFCCFILLWPQWAWWHSDTLGEGGIFLLSPLIPKLFPSGWSLILGHKWCLTSCLSIPQSIIANNKLTINLIHLRSMRTIDWLNFGW